MQNCWLFGAKKTHEKEHKQLRTALVLNYQSSWILYHYEIPAAGHCTKFNRCSSYHTFSFKFSSQQKYRWQHSSPTTHVEIPKRFQLNHNSPISWRPSWLFAIQERTTLKLRSSAYWAFNPRTHKRENPTPSTLLQHHGDAEKKTGVNAAWDPRRRVGLAGFARKIRDPNRRFAGGAQSN